MSGGKGGSQSAQVQIPQWAEDAARQNIARAQAVQNMPYAPIMGPTMAGFTSGQKAGMESQAALAQRMGIIPQSYDVASGYMPGEIDAGNGLTAYASYPGAKERVLAAFEENPALQRSYESLYANAPAYQEIRTADAISQLPSNTLDALVNAGVLVPTGGDGGGDGATGAGRYGDPASGLQFTLAEAYQNLQNTPFGVITSPGTAIAGSLANMGLEDQGYSYVKDPNAVGGGYYRDTTFDRTYGDSSGLGDNATAGQKAAMSGWSE